MTQHTWSRAWAALAVATTLVLSACGSEGVDDGDPEALVEAATTAVLDADAVTISGSSDDGESRLELDLSLVGESASGTVSIDDATFAVRGADGDSWFSADDAFWTTVAGYPADAAARVADRWVVTDLKDPVTADFAQFADRRRLVETLLSSDGDLAVDEDTTIKDVDYDVLVSTAADGTQSRLFLDAGSHRPLKIEADSGVLSFTYGGEGEEAVPPAESEIVDLMDLAR